MYDFVDTGEVGSENSLPSEALQIDGEYIENLIDGYRTLYVSGRELLESEITDREIDGISGSEYLESRNITRNVTVGYQLLCKTTREFRDKFNKLSSILSKEQVKLIFADEPDKYFIGTKSSVGDVEPGRMNVKGEFTFYCCDPCKYSSAEKQFPGVQQDGYQTITIQNNGTEWADVDYEITHKHENGYIGLVSQYGTIQLGKVEETDLEDYEASETLINDIFSPSTSGWVLNNATTVHVVSEHKQTGNLAITNGTGGYALRVTNYGTGEQWHGPSWTKQVPMDSNGHTGAKNCTLSWHHYFTTSTFNNRGVIQFLMTDRNKKNVAAMTVFKNELGNNRGYAEFFVNGLNKGKIEFDCSWDNPRTGQNAGKSSISKFGDRFEFNVNGEVKPFTVPEMIDIEVTEISIFIGVWGSGEGIGENHVYSIEFTSHSVDAQRDIPNRFRAGSVVQINGESTKVYVDGVASAGHEVNGTDYFKVPPGTTEVQFYYSDFSSPPPTIRAKIREVYL
jgi:putative phage tail component, N-terminal domain